MSRILIPRTANQKDYSSTGKPCIFNEPFSICVGVGFDVAWKECGVHDHAMPLVLAGVVRTLIGDSVDRDQGDAEDREGRPGGVRPIAMTMSSAAAESRSTVRGRSARR